MKSKKLKYSDFWWLTPEESVNYKYLYLCDQEPYSDQPYSSRDPLSASRVFSLDTSGNPSIEIKYYPLEFIDYWRKKFANINVFRSFGLLSAEQNGEELPGPFLIDIDREEGGFSKGYVQNLDEALKDTRRLVNEYLYKVKKDDFRIFFTGHKGFNIEVRPKALGIVSTEDRLQQFKRRLEYINKVFGGSKDKKFVDKIHDEIRLHDSINRWIANDGKIMNRMKFEVSLDELNSIDCKEIIRESELLASVYLNEGQAV